MSPERVGNIRIEGVLGQGGMGTVYVGFDETLERRVALKAIRADRDVSETARARFLREAKVLSQLEHPHICRIHDFLKEADGTDYLVLEYVEGHPLSHHIEAGTLRAAHRLRIALQIAEALVAAHAKGIVHRDLKPDNVRVTPEGDAKILDFGLARVVEVEADADGEVAPADVPEDDAAGETWSGHSGTSLTQANVLATEAGAIMGTPLFMSPEQANPENTFDGDAPVGITTASDVYSFGLLLQHLYSGERPYPTDMSRRELMLRAALGEASWPTELPPQVLRIVQRCRALAPAARATAVEVLERLRAFEERPARLLRRAVVAALLLIALAAAVKYTVDLREQKELASDAADSEREQRRLAVAAALEEKRQRELAVKHRDLAEGLLGFVLDDLSEKLESSARKRELLADTYEQVLEGYAAFEPEDLSTESLWRLVQALYQRGEVIADGTSLPAAIASFEEALALGQELVAREPDNEQALVKLGYAHFWVGHGHIEEGDFDAAVGSFEASADVARRLVELDPDNPEYQLELVAEESNIAQIMELQERYDEAIVVMRRRLETVERLAASDPSRTDWQLELANSHILLGRVLESRKQDDDLTEAEACYERDIEIMLALLALDPEHAERRDRLGTSYNHMGNVLNKQARFAEAEEYYGKQKELAEQLAAGDTGNASFSDHAANSLATIGETRREQGDFVAARDPLVGAARMFAELSEEDPTRARWRSEGARFALSAFEVLVALGETEEARDVARRALALGEAVPREDRAADELERFEALQTRLLALDEEPAGGEKCAGSEKAAGSGEAATTGSPAEGS